jgi:hypothetical protein
MVGIKVLPFLGHRDWFWNEHRSKMHRSEFSRGIFVGSKERHSKEAWKMETDSVYLTALGRGFV